MTALFVDHGALLVHHVVVFEQVLTRTEVVFFDLLLCAFDALADHAGLDHLAVLETEFIHDTSNAFGGEKTHEFVFERNVEDGASDVTLTTCTTTKLAIDTTAVVTLRADDGQTAGSTHFVGEFDVGTTTGHVGGNRYGAEQTFFFTHLSVFVFDLDDAGSALTGLRYNVGFLLVEFRIEHLVWDVTQLEQAAEQFGDFNRTGTHENGTTAVAHAFHFFDHGIILLALRFIDAIVHVDSLNGAVGGDFHHIELVDIPELAGLGDGRTGHTCEFVIHAEIVLQRDGREGLRGGFDLDVLFRFDGLVQTIAPTTAFHDTTRRLVDDLHLSVLDDVIVIEREHRIGFEELLERVHAIGFHGIFGE